MESRVIYRGNRQRSVHRRMFQAISTEQPFLPEITGRQTVRMLTSILDLGLQCLPRLLGTRTWDQAYWHLAVQCLVQASIPPKLRVWPQLSPTAVVPPRARRSPWQSARQCHSTDGTRSGAARESRRAYCDASSANGPEYEGGCGRTATRSHTRPALYLYLPPVAVATLCFCGKLPATTSRLPVEFQLVHPL